MWILSVWGGDKSGVDWQLKLRMKVEEKAVKKGPGQGQVTTASYLDAVYLTKNY